MFKRLKKSLLAGTIFTAAANMHGCVYGPPESFTPEDNENMVVYGPPSETQIYDEGGSSSKFDPEDNQNDDVYGPPVEDFDPDADEEAEADSANEKFSPEQNINMCVYGPPEMMGGERLDDSDDGR